MELYQQIQLAAQKNCLVDRYWRQMMNFGQDIGQTACVPAGYYDNGPKMIRQPTLQERLDLAVKQAEERLAKVQEARDIFSRNPDIERLLDIMQSSHF